MITPVDSDESHAVLRELLHEFHEWVAQRVGEAYDVEAEVTADVRSLEREDERWAWIAHHNGTPAGCVLLIGDTDDLAEFRRLWVRPAYRGTGIRRTLVRTLLETVHAEGYVTLRLVTPPWSELSHDLYESMGFELLPPYPGTRLHEKHHRDELFMQLDLADLEHTEIRG